jgi:hypothetical protein
MTFGPTLGDVTNYQREVCSWPAQKQRVGNVIFPSQEITSMPITSHVNWPRIYSNAKGLTQMWIVGCIPYWDQFGIFRQTEVFYMYNFLTGDGEFKPTGTIKGTLEPYFSGNIAK